ncbi:DUF3617 domain-containing protein [Stakelama marina]|uniref:DUF3617 domain-containing protein n=1 Tax=Stakelama marina TaxID=2826939 RepID=A0A8T4IFW9_9SPHN|nr:DUF3617 domain-containing protein [Stakelama marina]MBR0553351.1 DUF3617 domain-containing protein [Stakelama marina]
MHATTTILLVAVAAATAGGPNVRPGEWKTTTTIVDFDMALPPGAPPGMLDMVKSRMNSHGMSHSQCITAADLRDAPQKLVKSSKGKCSYDSFSMAGGKLHATATCNMEQSGTMKMTMDGRYTATTMDSTMEMRGKVPSGPMRMTMKMHGQRTGDCG